MNNKKNIQKQSYKKSSMLFMQLGLILALFTAYTALEMEMNYKVAVFEENIEKLPIDPYTGPFKIEKDKPKQKKIITKKVIKPIKKVTPKVIEEIKIIDDKIDTPETKVNSIETTQETKIVTELPTSTGKTETKIEVPKTFSILGIQEMPTFPGCKGNFDEKKACFESKIRKHIFNHFDNDLAQSLNLDEGIQRIRVQFIIDENGNIVGVKARANHEVLEKEAKRIIKKLPKMIPGKQNKKSVRVKYNVPINFEIEN